MTRTARQYALLLLLGICLAGFAAPRAAWCQESEPGAKKEEKPRHELLYKTINFLILVGALGYVLRKPAAEFFNLRTAAIAKGLDEGRKAMEESQARLKEVEGKLSRLEAEIAAFKDAAQSEMAAERVRMQQATTEEGARMLESARAQTETMVRAARLELRGYAAIKAVDLAEQLIRSRIDDAGQRRLVTQFVAKVESKEQKN